MSDEAQVAAPAEAIETTQDESQETLESSVAPAAEAKKESVKRKLKLRIDGEDFDEEFDPNDDEYLTRQFQLAKVAQKRMQSYTELEKDVNDFISQLKKDPNKVLSDPSLNLDLKKFAAQIIEKEIEDSKKTPDQLEAEKAKAELKALKDEREKEQSEAKAREFERLKEQEFERYDMLMEQALSKTDLPKSPYVVKKMADYMLIGLQNGKDVKPEDVLPLVQEEIKEDIAAMFKAMPDEIIEKIVGKDVFNRIRKKNIAKVKENKHATQGIKAADIGKTKEEAPKTGGAKRNYRDFFGV